MALSTKQWLGYSLILNLLMSLPLGYAVFKRLNRPDPFASSDMRRASKMSVFEVLPVIDTMIFFVGDSHIERCHWYELLQRGDIVNRGIGGDMTAGVLQRLDQITKYQPAKVFLMIGINDLLFRGLTVDEVVSNYQTIIHRLSEQSPRTTIYTHSLLPIHHEYWNMPLDNELVVQVNQALQTFPNVTYIDLYTPLVQTDGRLNMTYSLDGLHLNGKGYLLWRDLLLPYLNDLAE